MNQVKYKHIFLGIALASSLLVGSFLLLARTQTARADPGSLFVAPGGSGSSCSQASPCALQTALSMASDGDVIYLAAGVYTGTGAAVITITRSITLYGGWDGSMAQPVVRDPVRYASIMDGEGQRRGIYINSPITPTIDGCTIVRRNATAGPAAGRGGGIYSYRAVVLAHNVVSGCVATTSDAQDGYGGGIYVEAGPSAALVANRVEGNIAATAYRGRGGGIAVIGGVGVIVADNLILSNTASLTGGLGYGGGLWMSNAPLATVRGNIVEHNIAQVGSAPALGSRGGGMCAEWSNGLILTGNIMRHNSASASGNGSGGGMHLRGTHDVLVQGNLLQGNVACSSLSPMFCGIGGALYMYASQRALLDANQFLDNQASTSRWGYGGAVYFCRNTSFTMTNNIVVRSHASYQGGGIAFETSTTEPVSGTLLHNTFVNNNLGIEAGRYAIHVNRAWVTLALTNNLFSGHAYAVYGNAAATVTMNCNLFWDNSLGDIGGENVVNLAPITGMDPLLNPTYHLLAGSPAIDAALPSSVTHDIDGDVRPYGAQPDIGADEWLMHLLHLPLVVQ
ncbi:MAG: right-handed parallel beta-helix repeat-containing protein [Chloroflexi bacterium]|nr:right-handed parallel beta-helix repeat-containing protein [Chloroflexota bacterium]